MASDKEFLDFVLEQIGGSGPVSCRKMFGEYAIYLDGKIVAMICDNRFFVKPTDGGRSFIGDPVETPPYPGAKPCFLIEDQLDDREWVGNLIRITSKGLPAPDRRKKDGKTQKKPKP
jgi:TfoX/Sxy family transcriptional regulator of competence genes